MLKNNNTSKKMVFMKTKKKERIQEIIKTLMYHEKMTLAEITNNVNLSLPKVTEIVTELRELKIINDLLLDDLPLMGRPSQKFKLNSDYGYFLGIDLGRIHTNIVVLDYSQKKIYEDHLEPLINQDTKVVAKKLHVIINQILREQNISLNKVMGIGVSLPGIVDSNKGISHTYLKIEDLTIREYFEEVFKVKVRIEHDVKSMTLGELYYGKEKGLENGLYLNFGWGLGLGIIINKELYYGKDSYCGEFGHVPVVPNGELCYCGKTGCLETVASGKAITKNVREKISAGASSMILNKINDPEKIGPLDILKAANKGDQFSIEILEEAGRYLGIGIAMLINIFNPEKIIIGGTFTQVASYILDVAKSNAMKHSLTQLNKSVKFEISNLRNNASALGVARLTALENCMKLN
jgi:predicted NBD/HSP70 family sugar kinase